MLTGLNNIPTALQPYVAPLVAAVSVIMGLLAIAAFNNQGLKDAVKGHIPWIIFGLLLIGGGAGFFLAFRT
jgi:hypothetical protein